MLGPWRFLLCTKINIFLSTGGWRVLILMLMLLLSTGECVIDCKQQQVYNIVGCIAWKVDTIFLLFSVFVAVLLTLKLRESVPCTLHEIREREGFLFYMVVIIISRLTPVII